ncbi:MAG: BlaI/MecI/CopY family transcriptional regulator [Acidobacteriota bacterium]
MERRDPQDFSRRERQIMDVVYQCGHATAAQVLEHLPDPPGYSTVRTLLGVLERKGHLRHERRGYHYVYFPTTPVEEVSTSVLRHVMDTFFKGSATKIVSAVLDLKDTQLSEGEYEKILKLVQKAREEGV